MHKSHNVSVLIYHFVCPAKYRRVVFGDVVDEILKDVCQEIELRYDIRFLEIGTDKNHVHFLIQSAPKISATQIIRIVKSITAKEVLTRCPQVKKKLWGGEFWSEGYYVSTVGQRGNEKMISNYVRNQGKESEYRSMLKKPLQLSLFSLG